MENHPIKKLSSLIGTWKCEEIYHAGGWVPAEVRTQKATDVFRWGPGGYSILADYESESDVVGKFEAVDLILWDKKKEKFIFIIVYNFNAEHEIQEGYMPDDNHIIFESKGEFNNEPVTVRRTYTLGDNQSQLNFDYVSANGIVTPVVTIKKEKL